MVTMHNPVMASKPMERAMRMPRGRKASMDSPLPVMAGSIKKGSISRGMKKMPPRPFKVFMNLPMRARVDWVDSMTWKEPPMMSTIQAIQPASLRPRGMATKTSNRLAGLDSTTW